MGVQVGAPAMPLFCLLLAECDGGKRWPPNAAFLLLLQPCCCPDDLELDLSLAGDDHAAGDTEMAAGTAMAAAAGAELDQPAGGTGSWEHQRREQRNARREGAGADWGGHQRQEQRTAREEVAGADRGGHQRREQRTAREEGASADRGGHQRREQRTAREEVAGGDLGGGAGSRLASAVVMDRFREPQAQSGYRGHGRVREAVLWVGVPLPCLLWHGLLCHPRMALPAWLWLTRWPCLLVGVASPGGWLAGWLAGFVS